MMLYEGKLTARWDMQVWVVPYAALNTDVGAPQVSCIAYLKTLQHSYMTA